MLPVFFVSFPNNCMNQRSRFNGKTESAKAAEPVSKILVLTVAIKGSTFPIIISSFLVTRKAIVSPDNLKTVCKDGKRRMHRHFRAYAPYLSTPTVRKALKHTNKLI